MATGRARALRRYAEQEQCAEDRRDREGDVRHAPRASRGEDAGEERRGEEREMPRGRVRAERDASAGEGEDLGDERRRGCVIRAAREAHHEQAGEQHPVRARETDGHTGQTDEEEAADDDAPRAHTIRDHPERRVGETRGDRICAHREAGLSVRERERVADERQERGQQAVGDVMREVGDAERRQQASPRHESSLTSRPKSALSMSRALPTRAASERTTRSAGPSSSVSANGSAADTYSSATPGASV